MASLIPPKSAEQLSGNPDSTVLSGIVLCGVSGLSFLGFSLSSVLFRGTFRQNQLPLGCGPESGCQNVLTSHWSQVFNIPVTLPAILIYLIILISTFTHWRSPQKRWPLDVWRICSGVLISTAIWFTLIQAIILQSFCVYCCATHLVGLTTGTVCLSLSRQSRIPILYAISIGLFIVGAVAFCQWKWPSQHNQTAQALQEASPHDQDTASNSLASHISSPQRDVKSSSNSRIISVLNNTLVIDLNQHPYYGNPNAEHMIVVFYDHACPHCRTLHQLLDQQLHAGQDWCIVPLPIPLEHTCNPKGVLPTRSGARFMGSCDRAEIAAAVFAAKGLETWRTFDQWLLNQDPIPNASAAQTYAESLVGVDLLKTTRQNPATTQMLQKSLEAYLADDNLRRLPILMSPGKGAISAPHDAEEINEWLNQDR